VLVGTIRVEIADDDDAGRGIVHCDEQIDRSVDTTERADRQQPIQSQARARRRR
jgi:hypothetical protein